MLARARVPGGVVCGAACALRGRFAGGLLTVIHYIMRSAKQGDGHMENAIRNTVHLLACLHGLKKTEQHENRPAPSTDSRLSSRFASAHASAMSSCLGTCGFAALATCHMPPNEAGLALSSQRHRDFCGSAVMVLRATVPPYDTRGVASVGHPLARLSAATRLFTPATAIHTRLSARHTALSACALGVQSRVQPSPFQPAAVG